MVTILITKDDFILNNTINNPTKNIPETNTRPD
jgi:hypothetical protein